MRTGTLVFGMGLLVFAQASALAGRDLVKVGEERAYSAFNEDPHRQFDFWIGEWDVNLRTVDKDHQFRDSAKAHASIFSILHGKAVLELWDGEALKGYSLRYFDPDTDEWIISLNWPGEDRTNIGTLTGGFRHGRGEFVGEYRDVEGTPVLQRYTFSDITPFSLRWDDLRSADGGASWRENWRMEFTRTATEPVWPVNQEVALTWDTGKRCALESFRPYEVLAGHWHGRFNNSKASLSAWKILDGCGVMVFIDVEKRQGARRFMALTFDTTREQWHVSWLDDKRESGLLALTSKENWSRTIADDAVLEWQVRGDELEYSLTRASGERETGRFRRQKLEGH